MEPTQRRKELLDAAKQVFAEKGYHAAGVADIVERAEVARGTFYLYFKSKREVFAALLDYTFQTLMERLHMVSMDQPESIIRGLLDNISAIERYFEEDSEQANIIIREAMLLDDESAKRVDEMRQALVEFIEQLLTHWQEQGILRPLNPSLTAHAVVGAVRGIFEQRMIHRRLEAGDGEVMEHLLSLFVFGIIDPEHFELAAGHMRDIGLED